MHGKLAVLSTLGRVETSSIPCRVMECCQWPGRHVGRGTQLQRQLGVHVFPGGEASARAFWFWYFQDVVHDPHRDLFAERHW